MKKKFTAATVSALLKAGKPGTHADTESTGLYLKVTGLGTGSWFYRGMIAGKRSRKGLGAVSKVSLAQARIERDKLLGRLLTGANPIAQARAARATKGPTITTFRQLAESHFEIMARKWAAKSLRDWQSRFNRFVYPVLGNIHPSLISVQHVERVLEPIWEQMPKTAEKIRHRIEKVLARGIVLGLIEGRNVAAFENNLDTRFHRQRGTSSHYPALPVELMGAYWQRLGKEEGPEADSLKMTILAAVRSSEARLTEWSELDLKAREWNIPAEKRKDRRALTVPLTSQMIEILMRQPRTSNYVFVGKSGRALSHNSLRDVMDRLHAEKLKQDKRGWTDREGRKASPHGFRSCFAKWSIEANVAAQCISDAALGHSGGDKVAASYFRAHEILILRRRLMESWCQFVTTTTKAPVAEVEA